MCDAVIDAAARNCPSCLTDLSLFDVSGSTEPAADLHASEDKSIDEILASIMDGHTDRPEIFESLKNVGTSQPVSKDLVVESKRAPPPPRAEPEEQFLCPVCETAVRATDTVCPGCGAEFSEGESTEYECPVCKASVPADAASCPSCGVRFAGDGEGAEPEAETPTEPPRAKAEPSRAGAARPGPTTVEAPVSSAAAGAQTRSPRSRIPSRMSAARDAARSPRRDLPTGDVKLMARELPRLVNDVKPLLVSAKRIGLDIEAGKRLINDAVQAGKRRDIERSVRLIADARRSLDAAFVEFIGRRIESFAAEVDRAEGTAALAADGPLMAAVDALEKADYDKAWDSLEAATSAFKVQAKEYTEAQNLLETDTPLLGEVRGLGMDVQDVERLARQSKEALERRDLAGAVRLARQSHERLYKNMPTFVEDQMKRARDLLLDLKVRGLDLSKPVGYLKEASAHAKGQEWGEALRYLREFHKELNRVSKA